MLVGDVDDAERGGDFEQQAQQVAFLQDVPSTGAFVAEAAVLALAQIKTPRVVGHFKHVNRGLHVARQLCCSHPLSDQAIAQRLMDRLAPVGRLGQLFLSLVTLSLDRVDPGELIDEIGDRSAGGRCGDPGWRPVP